MELAELLVETF